jgi:hypothetical protein
LKLTVWDGGVTEEIANKATMLCNHAIFAYTGNRDAAFKECTDELLLRCLAQPKAINDLLAGLDKEAAQEIRNPLTGLSSKERPRRDRTVIGLTVSRAYVILRPIAV